MSPKRILLIVLGAALLGWSIFAALLWRVSDYQAVAEQIAAARADSVRASFPDPTPLLPAGDAASVPADSSSTEVRTLHVLAYRASMEGLLQIDIPLWFLRLKGPAIEFVLRDTDVDLEELGLTAEKLKQHGPGIILDEQRPNGDSVLLWTDAH